MPDGLRGGGSRARSHAARKSVRPPKEDTSHECPAPWCNRRVARHMFACRADWMYLPKHLRDDIWAGYRDQTDGGHRHRMAMATAITFYRDNPR